MSSDRTPTVHRGLQLAAALTALSGLASAAPQQAPTPNPNKEVPDLSPGVPAGPALGPTGNETVFLGGFRHVQVNVDANGNNVPGDAANEPSIAVDPTSPNRIAIGWRQFDTIASNFRQAGIGYSTDGGRTWSVPPPLEAGVFRSDPVLTSDSAGNFYYNSVRFDGGGGLLCDVFKSSDGGATWGLPVLAFGGDKAWMIADRSGGIGDSNLYCSWSVFAGCCNNDTFNRSLDGGLTFTTPIAAAGMPVWGTLAVGSDGALYLAGANPLDLSSFLVAKSSNAGDPLAAVTWDFANAVDLGGSLSWSTGPNPGGLLSQVWVATGASASDVYVLSSVNPSGPDPLDVYFARSTDGGQTWDPPVRVNDDAPAAGSWQWFGTMAIAPNGRIDAVWNDTRASGQDNVSELYHASSDDGGQTWSANQALSPAFDSHVGWPSQDKIGDYYHLVSDDVGAHLAWAATFNGEQDVYYLRIGDYDCNQNGIGDATDVTAGTSTDENANGIPDECEPAVGDALCFGVGCPCGNDDASAGCATSTGSGGRLAGFGSASAGADDLVLLAADLPPGNQGLFYTGDTLVQNPFFDGFQCALGTTFRFLDSIQNTGAGGVMSYGSPAGGSGGLITAGSTWYFHAWFRDVPGTPCGTGANLTHVLRVTFGP